MNCPRCGTKMQGGVCPECGFPVDQIWNGNRDQRIVKYYTKTVGTLKNGSSTIK